MRKALALCGALLLAANTASAVDGVLELNRACVADGCFPGDGPGLPIVIAFAGSYRLTSSIVGAPGMNAIEIAVASGGPTVTLDLNGFELVGGPGSLNGIVATSLDVAGVTVRHGTVRGFGSNGIALANAVNSMVDGVLALANGANGIAIWGIVRDSTAQGNGQTGILVSPGGLVQNCVAQLNTGVGIYVAGGSVSGSRANGNQSYGIQADSGVVEASTVAQNQLAGIRVSDGMVTNSSSFGAGGCISANGNSLVAGNICSGPAIGLAQIGISVGGSRNRIESNNVVGYGSGIVVTGTSNLIIRNSASNNGTNYQIGAGNTSGPVISGAAIATDSNPHANYAY